MARRWRGRRSTKGMPFGTRPKRRKFQAYIFARGSQRNLGVYDSVEEAHAVAVAAKRKEYNDIDSPPTKESR
jgi:hypothetical protein